jgi:hypothetical protein
MKYLVHLIVFILLTTSIIIYSSVQMPKYAQQAVEIGEHLANYRKDRDESARLGLIKYADAGSSLAATGLAVVLIKDRSYEDAFQSIYLCAVNFDYDEAAFCKEFLKQTLECDQSSCTEYDLATLKAHKGDIEAAQPIIPLDWVISAYRYYHLLFPTVYQTAITPSAIE